MRGWGILDLCNLCWLSEATWRTNEATPRRFSKEEQSAVQQ